MLDRSQFMPIVYLKKAKFTGSYKGMRYRMEKASRPAESGGEGEEETRRQEAKEREMLYEFQRKVAEYYGLEERSIRIAW